MDYKEVSSPEQHADEAQGLERPELLAAYFEQLEQTELYLAAYEARHELAGVEEVLAGTELEGKSLDRSPKQNWVDKVGGLPQYIERIAKHLVAKGMSVGHAIAAAVNAAKKMCATGDVNWPGHQNVNAGSRAEACAAVADWEAKKVRARAS